jgi:hypothetical protein
MALLTVKTRSQPTLTIPYNGPGPNTTQNQVDDGIGVCSKSHDRSPALDKRMRRSRRYLVADASRRSTALGSRSSRRFQPHGHDDKWHAPEMQVVLQGISGVIVEQARK